MSSVIYPGSNLPPIDAPLRKRLTEYGIGILLGIGCGFAVLTQAVSYLTTHRKDATMFHRLVTAVSLLTLAHTACSMADFLIVMCQNFGNANVFLAYSPLYSAIFVLDGIIAGMIQAFYGWRVWSLHGHRVWLVVLFVALVAFTVSTWLYMGISVQLPQEEGDFTTRAALLAFTAPVVCDLVITAFMLGSIKQAHGRSTEKTRSWLRRIALQTVTTNALTSAFCIVQLGGEVSIFTSSSGQPWAGVNILLPILPHVYTATLLTWLLAKRPSADSVHHLSGSDPTATIGQGTGCDQQAAGARPASRQQESLNRSARQSHASCALATFDV